MMFFKNLPSHQSQCLQWGTTPLKIESTLNWKPNPSPLKSKTTFQEIIPRKKTQKSETVINTWVSLWKKMAKIPQTRGFLSWSIQNFVKKNKQFARKYCITWLIDLPHRLYDREKFLISFYVLLWKILVLLRNFAENLLNKIQFDSL